MADDDVLDNNVMLKIGGKSYRCACGANVFSKMRDVLTPGFELYRCNGCEQEFEAQ